MLELYDSHISPCAQKVRLVLHEKALSWTTHQLDLQAGDQFQAAYRKLNPNSVVPTLVHDGVVFNESTIINEYLDDAFPELSMRPEDPVQLARMRHWVKRIDDGAHAAIGMLSFATTRRHQLRAKMTPEQLQTHIDNIPNDYQRMWQREVITHGVEAPLVTGAVRLYDRLLMDMDAALADHEFLVGNDMTLADAALVPYVTRLEWLAMDELWRGACPCVGKWLSTMQNCQSYKKAITDVIEPEAINVLREYGSREWPALKAKLNH